MPTVQGKLTKPDLSAKDITSVTLEVVDTFGNPVRAFRTATKETVVGPQPVTVTNGVWTAVLPDNAGLNPAGTRYRRRIHLPGGVTIDDLLIVPVGGGPYDEEDILAAPLAPIPTATPSNEVDVAERTTNQAGLVLNGFNLIPIDDMVVTVPDLAQPVWIFCQLWMESSVANVNIDAAIAAPGSSIIGQQIAAAPAFVGAIGKETAPIAWARLPAHSPGEWQAAVTGDAGTITLIGGAKHRIAVLAV